jgi:hypothetical protein
MGIWNFGLRLFRDLRRHFVRIIMIQRGRKLSPKPHQEFVDLGRLPVLDLTREQGPSGLQSGICF